MKTYFELRESLQEKKLDELSTDTLKRYRKKAAGDMVKRDAKNDLRRARSTTGSPWIDRKNDTRKAYRKLAKGKLIQKDEGYVSAAQRKAVWANKADGGKGHPDKKK